MSSHSFLVGIIIITVAACSGRDVNAGEASPDKELDTACVNASNEQKYRLEFSTKYGVTKVLVCSIVDSIVDRDSRLFERDCYQLLEGDGGSILIYSKVDLNKDGLEDVISMNYMRGIDIDDIKNFMGFANCGKGVYLGFGIGYFSDVTPLKLTQNQRWPDLRVTRKCYNQKEDYPRLQVRSFLLAFDEKSFKYGSPNNDPELMDFCSDKELSLPFDSEEDL